MMSEDHEDDLKPYIEAQIIIQKKQKGLFAQASTAFERKAVATLAPYLLQHIDYKKLKQMCWNLAHSEDKYQYHGPE